MYIIQKSYLKVNLLHKTCSKGIIVLYKKKIAKATHYIMHMNDSILGWFL